MTLRTLRWVAVSVALVVAAMALRAASLRASFDHAVHGKLFPLACATCHAGVTEPEATVWPAAESCAACHDGEVAQRVDWTPPTGPPPSNLRFVHQRHAAATADSVSCAQCHNQAGLRGEVHRAVVAQCIDCHQPGGEHLAVADRQCATCHLPLAEATALPVSRVGAFPPRPHTRRPISRSRAMPDLPRSGPRAEARQLPPAAPPAMPRTSASTVTSTPQR